MRIVRISNYREIIDRYPPRVFPRRPGGARRGDVGLPSAIQHKTRLSELVISEQCLTKTKPFLKLSILFRIPFKHATVRHDSRAGQGLFLCQKYRLTPLATSG